MAHIMLSEVAEYITDETKLSELVNLACSDYQNAHPKIRWSAMHIIGQVCEDHSPNIQNKLHETIASTLIVAMDD